MKLASIRLRNNQSKIAVLAIAYGLSGWFTQTIIGLTAEASPIWFPAGIALAALLCWGKRVWHGIFWGDFFFSLFLGTSLSLSLTSALGSSLAALLALKLLKNSRFSLSLNCVKDVIKLFLLSAIIAPIVNASLHIFISSWQEQVNRIFLLQEWFILWLGDCTGILVVTPFLLRLYLDRGGIYLRKTQHRFAEAGICFGLLLGVGWFVFSHNGINNNIIDENLVMIQYLEYLPFPLIIWAALRFQTWGAVGVNLLIAILALIGTLQGVGPFLLQTLTLKQAILLLQIYIGVISITSLCLAAAVSEFKKAEKQLRNTWEREHLVTDIALRIRESLELEYIFKTTVKEVRQVLNVDRVHIGYVSEYEPAKIAAESIIGNYKPLLNYTPSENLLDEIKILFDAHKILVINNIAQAKIPHSLREFYNNYQIKSALVVPLMVNNQYLGLLGTHQCSYVRTWQKEEIKLLTQLATQVSIAIQQAQLYQQVQNLNNNLEKQVEERTLQVQEKIEELQQYNEMKTVFLQALSHDLRTSIMGLMMLLRNLQHQAGDNISLSRSILDRVVQSGERQLTLINALSEDHFSQHSPLVLHCQHFSFKELIDDIVKEWQPLFIQNKVKFKSLIPHQLPNTYADIAQLRCVFDQLLTNALKHNKPGINLTLEISLEKEMIRCKLSDDGIGMAAEECRQLFKLYVRSIHNHRRTGIGLGSYQCRQIIEAHGGKIGVESNPGCGSQFWFTLPITASPAKFS